MKVNLMRGEIGWLPEGHSTVYLKSSLPFFISSKGKYVHRVRSAKAHYRNGVLTHTSVAFWCGNGGFISKDKPGLLIERPNSDQIVCSTCEGRAIGTGLFVTPVINGNPVIYRLRFA